MTSALTLRRSVAGALAAGAVLTGVAGVIGAGAALTAAPAYATPEEDCEAVRARDHQIYLNLIASLPPGSPIPPEYINPCLTAPSSTATVAPTTTIGMPGAQAPGGGPSVGANAPTNFPTYNGTPIVPVPGDSYPEPPGSLPRSDVDDPAGVLVRSTPPALTPAPPQPTAPEPVATTQDRDPGPISPATANEAPAQSDATPSVAPAGLADNGRDRYLELLLIGTAGFTAAGMGVRGRRSPFGSRTPWSGRTPESLLSQAVATIASPLMQYALGGQSKITVTEPDGGRRTFFLIHDDTSSHEAEIPVDVPPGGRMAVNPSGSVTVFDADGNPVSIVDAPWAYDADGASIPTHYEVRDGRLIQKVYADEASAYPILADPPQKSIGMVDTTGRTDGETWTEILPGGQTATHTLINAEAVDTRITREDNTWTDTRTNDDGRGNVNTWSDDSWGTASYNNTDVDADASSTDTWISGSPTTGAAPDAVSEANAANTAGSTVVGNQDGTTSTANWAANEDGSYDSAITNPDQTNSYVHSGALDENNDNYTTTLNPDNTQSVLTPEGQLIELDSEGKPVDLFDENSEMNTAWNPHTEQWEPVPNSMTSRTTSRAEPSTGDGTNWTTQFGGLNVVGGIVDAQGQLAEQYMSPRPQNMSMAQGAWTGVKSLAKPIPALGWFVTGAAIASDLKSENPPSVAESVATNVGGTVAAAAVGGVLAAGGAPILVVAGVGMLMGFGAAWAISKLW